MPTTRWGCGLAVLISACLAGCSGGGGSGSDDTAAGPPARLQPLALTAANSAEALRLSVSLSEIALALAELTGSNLEALLQTGQSSQTVSCEGGGQLTLQRPAGHTAATLAADERVQLVFKACREGGAFGQVDGSVLLTNAGAVSTGVQQQARLQPQSDFAVQAADGSSGFQLAGDIDYRRVHDGSRQTLEARGRDSAPLQFAMRSGSTRSSERLYLGFGRKLSADGEITVDLSASLDSDSLGGRIDLVAPVLRAQANRFPGSGSLRLQGRGVAVAQGILNGSQTALQLATDANADGQPDGSATLDWTRVATGNYLWWQRDPSLPPGSGGGSAGVVVTANNGFRDMPVDVVPSEVLSVFLPAVWTAPLPTVRLRSQDEVEAGQWLFDPVDTVVEVQGTHWLIRPTAPLQPRMRYRAEFLDAVTGQPLTAAPVVLTDFFHAALLTAPPLIPTDDDGALPPGQVDATDIVWQVADTVTARIEAPRLTLAEGTSVALDGSASSSTRSGPLGWQWAQRDATPDGSNRLLFDNPGNAMTGVSLANPQARESTSVVELAVTNSAAEIDRRRVSLRLLPSATLNAALFYVRGEPGEPVTNGDSPLFSAASGTLTAEALANGPARLRFDVDGPVRASLWLVLPTGEALQARSYGTVVGIESTSAQPALLLSVDGRTCTLDSGSIELRELEIDAAGRLQRLAADFRHHCNGAAGTAGVQCVFTAASRCGLD